MCGLRWNWETTCKVAKLLYLFIQRPGRGLVKGPPTFWAFFIKGEAGAIWSLGQNMESGNPSG